MQIFIKVLRYIWTHLIILYLQSLCVFDINSHPGSTFYNNFFIYLAFPLSWLCLPWGKRLQVLFLCSLCRAQVQAQNRHSINNWWLNEMISSWLNFLLQSYLTSRENNIKSFWKYNCLHFINKIKYLVVCSFIHVSD